MKRSKAISCCVVGAALCAALAPPAAARAIDLRDSNEPKLRATKDQWGMNWVAPAGDVNGDGEPDLILNGSDRGFNGVIRVFYGPLPRETTSLATTPRRGFSIYGPSGDDHANAARAGDVDGDGLDDIVVGAPGADEGWGRSYVVFGKHERDDVDLADFDAGVQGDDGYRIDDAPAWSVGPAGDTNGDGLDDFFLSTGGLVYVLRGKADTVPVDLSMFDYGLQGDAGYRIRYDAPRGDIRLAAFAGDATGDGVGDVAIATERRNIDYDVYVVFGKADGSDVDVRSLDDEGYLIDGGWEGGLAGAGDVNGDGRDDLVVGSYDAAYVVFGRAGTSYVSLSKLGKGGYRILGEPAPSGSYSEAGTFVAGGSDLNGDGRSDVVVTDYAASHRGRKRSGSAYLVFGKGSSKTIRLAKLGPRGVRIDGELAGDQFGVTPAMPGDVTDDGRPDLVIGAHGASRAKVHVLSHRLLFRSGR